MRESLVQKIVEHMKQSMPQEGVGFVVRTGKTGRGEGYVPLENKMDTEIAGQLVEKAPDANPAFLIDPKEYLKHSRDIKFIVHSHLREDDEEDVPSPADLQHQKATAVPWLIFVFRNGEYSHHYQFGE